MICENFGSGGANMWPEEERQTAMRDIDPDMRGSWFGMVSRLIYASAAAYQRTPGTPSEVASDLPSYGRLSRTLIPGRLARHVPGAHQHLPVE